MWAVCEEVFWNYPEEKIARAYSGTHQIVNAMYKEKGGDKFAQAKGGLHCGIRKAFVPVYEGDEPGENATHVGVELYESPDEVDATELKYKTPALTDDFLFDCGEHLNCRECEFLVESTEDLMTMDKPEELDKDHCNKLWFAFPEGIKSIDRTKAEAEAARR